MGAVADDTWPAAHVTVVRRAHAPSVEDSVRSAYERLRAAERDEPVPTYEWRRAALSSLGATLRRRLPELLAAADADFDGRSAATTKIGDVSTTLRELDYLLAHLRRFMAPERRRVALQFKPARAEVVRQPLGVVGVVAPWNYPFRLALGPLAAALAAGNRVLLKPSELAPCSADLLRQIAAEAFAPEQVQVVTGGAETVRALCAHPLDHLLFTGSSAVGREIMRLASRHLTPVTLELGGKCPAVVHRDAPLDAAVRRIVAGKLFNAGQTCMAPDHVWVHESTLEATLGVLRREMRRQFPTLADNPDYTAIISQGHLRRLTALVDDARAKGATVETVSPAGETFAHCRKLPPVIVSNVTDDMAVAEEEIFGPILPVRSYTDLDALLRQLRSRPSPLAAYYFDPDARRARVWLEQSRSGGACINDVILHGLQDDLPFGGVGASGFGRYHGREGFDTFSNQRAVLHQSRRNWAELLIPPYGRWSKRAIDWLSR